MSQLFENRRVVVFAIALLAIAAAWFERSNRESANNPPVAPEPEARGEAGVRRSRGSLGDAQDDLARDLTVPPRLQGRQRLGLGLKRHAARTALPAPPNTDSNARTDPEPMAADSAADEAEISALRQTALSDPRVEARISALESLAVADEHAALPVLTSALGDPSKSVRIAALQELEELDGDLPFEPIASAMNDSNPEVRAEALRILGESDDTRAATIARIALHDPDAYVREEAEDILDDTADAEPAQDDQ